MKRSRALTTEYFTKQTNEKMKEEKEKQRRKENKKKIRGTHSIYFFRYIEKKFEPSQAIFMFVRFLSASTPSEGQLNFYESRDIGRIDPVVFRRLVVR